MRECVRRFIEKAVERFSPSAPVLEIGAFQVPGQEHMADLRDLFPEPYVGLDMRHGTGVDVVADGTKLPFPDRSFQTVICAETLEHVEYPRLLADEVHRVLSIEGLVIVTTCMNFRIHDHPSDYWRFTPEGLKSVFNRFKPLMVGIRGYERNPEMVALVARRV